MSVWNRQMDARSAARSHSQAINGPRSKRQRIDSLPKSLPDLRGAPHFDIGFRTADVIALGGDGPRTLRALAKS